MNEAGQHRDRLREAFDRIGQVPSLAAAVGAVLAVVHAVRPPGSDYDVSYGDPDLPFSVFVGIDGERRPNGNLRLAEGIVHECMHLQLTLMERAAPMVAGSAGRLYSPWQGTARPVLGVLHGLYVFRVIQDFHWALLEGGWVDPAERNYVARRIRTVEDEATSVADLAGSDELTAMGRRLVERLLAD